MSEGTESDARLRADIEALRMQRDVTPLRRRGARRRRLILAGVACALGGLALWRVATSALQVSVATATLSDAATAADVPVLSGAGYIVPGDKVVSVGARVPGRVERFLVEEGQAVKAGAALVQLDDREYHAAVDRTRAQLASARADAALAASELRRGRELYANGVLSQQELDVRINKLAVDRARVSDLEAALREAEINLDFTVLRAPTDGVILAKLKEAGEIAVPGGFSGSGDLVRMANLDEIRAEVDVNESDLALVHLGQRAEVTPDADPTAHFAATVVKLYPQVDRQKGTLKVEVRILQPQGRLLPDMSARVSFLQDAPPPGQAASRVVLVPAAALRRETDGRSFVWVVERGRARKAVVEEGGLLGDEVRIAKGLAGGESVIVGERVPARDGARVEGRSGVDAAGGAR